MTEKTVKEILESLENVEDRTFDLEDICFDLNLPYVDWYDYMNEEQFELRRKPFDTWICTDTLVGKHVIYLKNVPVAISVKPYRKSDTEYHWFSKETVHDVREYIKSLMIDKGAGIRPYINMDTIVPIEGDQE